MIVDRARGLAAAAGARGAGRKRVEALVAVPPVVTALDDHVHFLPAVLPRVGQPELVRGSVEAVAPRIAQAVSPDLFAVVTRRSDERVVRGNTVGRLTGDIKPEHLTEQAIDILPVVLRVALAATIARREVEVPV